MIDCIFTVDYEIYGNGQGSLRKLVYEPAESLKVIFEKWNAKFVVFVEVAELEMIESKETDRDIGLVKRQVRDFHEKGFELGLHIHPWWYNARYQNKEWILDHSEYNLCVLSKQRISQIIDRSISYFQKLVGTGDFMPLSFRAGHLLFQPAATLANVLAERGIKVDSSVYKGGLWNQHKLDYRKALRNGYYWTFKECTVVPDPQGHLLEFPIHTQMVPIWKMFTSQRIGLQMMTSSSAQTGKKMASRLKDFLRFHYPLKFDIGQMTREEVVRMIDNVVREDHEEPSSFRPIVVMMHTKDPINFESVDFLLAYLRSEKIGISDFNDAYRKVQALIGRKGTA